ncbi:nucleotide exchange factor GrpE [Patescibacteria group bacterium]|nr:nucleotide exchange factor GrpE [Patescibacteria group bacterium]
MSKKKIKPTNKKPAENTSDLTAEDLENKCQEYEAGWRRALADYENLKKQMANDMDVSRARICISFTEDLLPVMDNFDQAVLHAPNVEDQSDEIKNWLQGILYIKKQFEDVISDLGASKIIAQGHFDPNIHEAAGTESQEDMEENQIISEVQSGWKLGSRIIRPAKVIINQKKVK